MTSDAQEDARPKILARVNQADGKSLHGYHFQCPGCEDLHTVGAQWTFNGDMERPTFKPSVLVTYGLSKRRCHSFVEDGRIRFLSDCTHNMAGTVADLPPLPDWLQDPQ